MFISTCPSLSSLSVQEFSKIVNALSKLSYTFKNSSDLLKMSSRLYKTCSRPFTNHPGLRLLRILPTLLNLFMVTRWRNHRGFVSPYRWAREPVLSPTPLLSKRTERPQYQSRWINACSSSHYINLKKSNSLQQVWKSSRKSWKSPKPLLESLGTAKKVLQILKWIRKSFEESFTCLKKPWEVPDES